MTTHLSSILHNGAAYLKNYSAKIGKKVDSQQIRLITIEKGIQTVTKFYENI